MSNCHLEQLWQAICSSEKLTKSFSGMPNVCGIVDGILVAGCDTDGKDHDDMVQRIVQRCREVILKLNKERCHFRWTSIPFFRGVISRNGVQLDPTIKESSRIFWALLTTWQKIFPSMMTICEPLWKLTSSRAAWSWNASYQAIYDKAKSFIKADACMKFYDESKLLYPETDASGVGLGTALLQAKDGAIYQKDTAPANTILRPIVSASKSLTSAEHRYSNIEREVLGILHGLEKFHHYCFARNVNVITNHKPLVAIFKKDLVTLLQRIHTFV